MNVAVTWLLNSFKIKSDDDVLRDESVQFFMKTNWATGSPIEMLCGHHFPGIIYCLPDTFIHARLPLLRHALP